MLNRTEKMTGNSFWFGGKDKKLRAGKMKMWTKTRERNRVKMIKWGIWRINRKAKWRMGKNTVFLKNQAWKITQNGFWIVEKDEILMEIKIKKWGKMCTIYVKDIKTAMQNSKIGKKKIKGNKNEYF